MFFVFFISWFKMYTVWTRKCCLNVCVSVNARELKSRRQKETITGLKSSKITTNASKSLLPGNNCADYIIILADKTDELSADITDGKLQLTSRGTSGMQRRFFIVMCPGMKHLL